VTDRIYNEDALAGAFYVDNICAEDVKLFLLKQMCKSLLFQMKLFLKLWIFCLPVVGGARQAQQSTHLAEGLNQL